MGRIVLAAVAMLFLLPALGLAAGEDVDNDGTISIADLLLVAKAISMKNMTADVNGDNVVNILDMVRVVKRLGQTVPPPDGAEQYFEAESFNLNTPMTAGSDPNASGGAYVHVANGSDSTNPSREASLQFSVQSGTYYLWVRIHGPTDESDALYIGIDDTWDRVYPSAPGIYEWNRVELVHQSGNYGFQLADGTHTFQIGHGEPFARADALFLTADPNKTPENASNNSQPPPPPPPPPSDGELAVLSVTASGDDGNVPENTLDKNQSTRWSSEGDGEWISYDLGVNKVVKAVGISWYNSRSVFDIQFSADGVSYQTVYSGTSGATTLVVENHDVPDATVRYVRIVGHGNTSILWNSITETVIVGSNGSLPQPICGNGIVEAGEQCDLGAGNGACPASCSASCTSNSCQSPPTCSLSASPTSGASPLSGTLSWTTTNGPSSCTASGGWSGSKSTSGGSQSFSSLTATTAYTLTCTNSAGSGNCSRTVTVTAPTPTCTLNANPSSGTSPLSGTLTWTTTNNPTSCTASGGWSGSKSTSGGSQSFSSLTATTAYTLTCTNSAGSNSCSRTVTVSQPPPPPPSGGIPGPVSTGGTTYYVSPSGSDSNSGSSSSPWRTLQKAANSVNPGDVVLVRDGVYTGSGDYVFQISRSGTASKWITFRSENQWGAIIDGENARHSGIRVGNDASYVRIDMFRIRNARGGGISANSYNVHHIYYYNNLIHNIGGYCTDSTGGIVGFRDNTDGHHMTYDSNIIHTIGRLTPADGCSYSTGNYKNHDHGLYINAGQLTIINNIFYNNKRGWDIQASGGAHDWVISNNVFADPNPDREGKIVLWNENTDITIENNIFYQPNTAAIDISNCGKSGILIRDNIITAGSVLSGSNCGGITTTNNKLSTDPKFVNPGARDYHLQASSPGVNTGRIAPQVPTDYDRVARPQGAGYDIGAFER